MEDDVFLTSARKCFHVSDGAFRAETVRVFGVEVVKNIQLAKLPMLRKLTSQKSQDAGLGGSNFGSKGEHSVKSICKTLGFAHLLSCASRQAKRQNTCSMLYIGEKS